MSTRMASLLATTSTIATQGSKQERAISMMIIHINTPSYESDLMLIDFNEKETHPGN